MDLDWFDQSWYRHFREELTKGKKKQWFAMSQGQS